MAIRLKIYFLLFSILLGFHCSIHARVAQDHIPPSLHYQLQKEVPVIHIPSVKSEAIKQQRNDQNLKNKVIALNYKTAYTTANSGVWEKLPEGGRLWRLGFYSPDAPAMHLRFSSFHIPKGARLYIYNQGYKDLRGAYSADVNNPSGIFTSPPVSGDTIYIELFVPDHYSKELFFKVKDVSRHISDVFTKDPKALKSSLAAFCARDVNCVLDSSWQDIIQSVFYFIFPTGNGTDEVCSGALINNTQNSGRPYFLTANHCIKDSATASQISAFFDYQSYYCNGPTSNRFDKMLSGARLIATAENIDFSLAEFMELPPLSYNPYYAGWNSSGSTPQTSVSIHHPGGEHKHVAIDSNEAIIDRYDASHLKNAHWRIKNWEIGTTEGGSSGGPLFNSDRQIIGSLVGGGNACSNPINDYFARFSVCWDEYPTASQSLKPWLDPRLRSEGSWPGYDPYQVYKDSCDTLKLLPNNTEVLLQEVEDYWGYYSGHNAMGFDGFAEYINNPSTLELPGIYLNVARAYENPLSFLSSVAIRVWGADENKKPDEVIYQKSYPLDRFIPGRYNYLAFDSTIRLEQDFFIGYQMAYSEFSDTFAISHSAEQIREQSFYVRTGPGNWQSVDDYTGGAFTGNLDMMWVKCDTLQLDAHFNPISSEYNPQIYPNPAKDMFHVLLQKPLYEGVEIKIYDRLGRVYYFDYTKAKSNQLIDINVQSLSPGMYVLQFLGENIHFTQKFRKE